MVVLANGYADEVPNRPFDGRLGRTLLDEWIKEENRWRYNDEPELTPRETCGCCDWCYRCLFKGHESVGYCAWFREFVYVDDAQCEVVEE